MAEFLQILASGLTVGAIYALIGIGFSMIYNTSDIINFAQGEFVMIGGMSAVALSAGGAMPLVLAGPPPIAITGLAGTPPRAAGGRPGGPSSPPPPPPHTTAGSLTTPDAGA